MSERLKDRAWAFNSTTHEDIQCALLMDLRDELKRLNALLHCPNFTGIPQTLHKIERNTRKKPRKK